jgi:hypothetical protein
MTSTEFIYKSKKRIWSSIVKYARNNPSLYPKIYKSYWHGQFHKTSNKQVKGVNYFTAVPNRGAGIGHQMANWIAGYWYAQNLELRFANTPFPKEQWDDFLGFGESEIEVGKLIKEEGYRRVLLPLFDETKPEELALIKKIVSSYSDQKVVFVAEQDQPYKEQCGMVDVLKTKFYNAKARQNDRLIFSNEHFNIAIHVRRGDILVGQNNVNANLLMRWQDNDFFEKVLVQVIDNIRPAKPIAIYLFSQGELKDFDSFKKNESIHFCLDMGAKDSFLHMVFADLLITSKSSFSYKPALLNKGIKVCPRNFWHGYPENNEWILVEDDGSFDLEQLQKNYAKSTY